MVEKMAKPKAYIQLDLFGRIPEVIVDIHEVNTKKPTSITLFVERVKNHRIEYKVQKLDVGDLVLPNEYVVERKSIRDFLNSLTGTKEGRARLLEQMRALSETYKNPVLLIEGGLSVRLDANDKAVYVPIRKKKIRNRIYAVIEERIGVHPNAYLGAIKKIEEMGIRVIKSYDAFHGSQVLWQLYLEAKGRGPTNKGQKDYAIIRLKPRLRDLRDQQIFFLCGLPGISYARAVRILETYKTPYNAIMKVRRWDIDVAGIGEATLDKVHKVLFSEFPKEHK